MSTGSGTGGGGTALFASPGRVPRGVAFAPAVRGYPGGIADMASDVDQPGPAGVGDGKLWVIAADAGLGDGPDQADDAPGQAGNAPGQVQPAGPIPVQPAQAESRQARPEPAGPVSVWQQSAAAWQDARIDWLRPASAGAGPAGSTRAEPARARPASHMPADDDPHTEPIPFITGDAAPGPAAPGGQGRTAGTAAPGGQGRPAAAAPGGQGKAEGHGGTGRREAGPGLARRRRCAGR